MTTSKRYEFTGELVRGTAGGYFIDFPFDVFQEFGTKKQVRVKIWFDGHMERKSLLPKGEGKHWISISYPTRTQLGKGDGDQLHMVVEPDLDPRTVEIPEDFEWLLDNDPTLKEVFFRQSYFNQKFFCDWITQSSSPESRVNRINSIFEWLEKHKSAKISAGLKKEALEDKI
jgi:hypothetical protein